MGKVGSKKHGKERVADFTTLTKGQAANMITRLRHGAKVVLNNQIFYHCVNITLNRPDTRRKNAKRIKGSVQSKRNAVGLNAQL